ncbi:MAG: hypothetical protein PHF31_16235 [Methylobacter sp.]|nr:hypothetical protein [Methylobacter sp.]
MLEILGFTISFPGNYSKGQPFVLRDTDNDGVVESVDHFRDLQVKGLAFNILIAPQMKQTVWVMQLG